MTVMPGVKSRVLGIAAFFFFGCAVASGQGKTPPADLTLKLQGLDGKIVDLSTERGSVVLVSFGATWCAPCTTELRALNAVLSEYRGKPVKFFWVSVERSEQVSNGELKQYARERKLAFPVLRDTGQMVFLQFADRVRLPMIVMLKDGKVAGPATFGMQSQPENYKAEIRARLNKLLNLPSPDGRGIEGEGAQRAEAQSLTPTLSQWERE
jgi:peroxiredoxin